MSISEIFETIIESQKANQFSLNQLGRVPSLQFAIVTNNVDPMKLRRIKVSTESKGNLTDSPWLLPLRIIPNYDPPLPPIGSSVVVGFLNDDPHDGVYLGNVNNLTNPPDQTQNNPLLDSTHLIEGDLHTVTGGKELHRTEDTHIITGKTEITIKNDLGAIVQLTKEGVIKLKAFNTEIVIGGLSGGLGYPSDIVLNAGNDLRINMGGNVLDINNASDVSINGHSVVVVGSTDSDGDVNNSRGY